MSEAEVNNQFYELRNAAFVDPNAAEVFLSEDPSSLQAKNPLGETAFHFLVVENAIESARCLLEQGADINTVSKFGDSPLSEAASLGYLEMCRFLLDNGADPRLHNQYGNTALAEAAQAEQATIVELLLSYVDDDEDMNTHFDHVTAMMLLNRDSYITELLKARGLKNPYV